MFGVNDDVRESVGSGVCVMEEVGARLCDTDTLRVAESLEDGVIELVYDIELLREGCAPALILTVGVFVFEDVPDGLRDGRDVRVVVELYDVDGVIDVDPVFECVMFKNPSFRIKLAI